MALELLMADYGDIVADYDEEEEEESSLLAETGNIFFEDMTNEMEERKTISVELAMQRELDYCNKIKEMKKELPGYDYEELSMPVQGGPSIFELWGIDVRSPPHNFSNTQGETSDSVVFAKKIVKEQTRDEMDIGKVANDNVNTNIMQFMPVELTIQREFAFQKKIKGIQLQPCCDFVELSMPVQGEPSTWEIGRRSPSDNFSNTQGETSDSIVFAEKIIMEEVRDEMNIAKVAKETLKRNIMSVELAIQRELAYQKKIGGMQLPPRDDLVELARKFSTELPVADQGTHSILEPTEMNTIPTSDNFPCFKERPTSEKVMWKTISVELALQREVEYQGKIKRLKLQAGNDFREATQPSIQGTTSDLELRNIDRESFFENGSSLQGWELEFQRKLQDLQSGFKFQGLPIPSQGLTPYQRTATVKETAPFANPAYLVSQKVKQHIYQKNPLYCKDCDVLCSGAKALKMHCRGKRHVTVVKRKKNGTGGRELVCEVCLVGFTDRDSLRLHLSGKKHAANSGRPEGPGGDGIWQRWALAHPAPKPIF
ncbi:hypothetical protein C5167_036014 [Papaver somniferum]|uniref:uncharacterized protein LOC113331537 n=1 Tax=Papaver somniferum TaxID=3469 RepID=UPI000E6F6D4A|nr:uncharacterized protein LOC113331537 [Papaver somniferum]RZC87475.1 hypothetical protein C5167_036014 [Papaver somniferum]